MLRESAVIAIPTDGFQGSLICCAYVPADVVRNLNAVLPRTLSKLLPGYMLPARWLSLDRLPSNANGKIDRRKLKEMFVAQNTAGTQPLQTDVTSAQSEGVARVADLRCPPEPKLTASPEGNILQRI